MQFILRWWLILEILGWLALPLAMRLFRWLPDRGYTLSKVFGLLLSSYFLWLGASTGFLNNDVGGILTAMFVTGALSAWSLWKNQQEGEPSILEFLRSQKNLIITSEILFLAALILWSGLRAYAPDKIMETGGEKFMEITFLNGILNSRRFPPLDPWLSGFSISYYYFGYVMMALLTRITGVPAGVGFDLTNALLFALTALGALGVAYNLVSLSARRLKSYSPAAGDRAVGFGLLAALMVVLMSNLEGVLESLRTRGLLSDSQLKWFDIPGLAASPVTHTWNPGQGAGWWWWRGSRVLQDYNLLGQPEGISPITEFPFFSFLLGDNHPHVLGLPLVLLVTAFALNLFEGQLRRSRQDGDSAAWWNPIRYCLDGDWLVFIGGGLLLGALAFNNTWDFPIYLGLALLAYLAANLAGARRFQMQALYRTVVLAVGWLFSAIGLYIFFYLSFRSQAGGILPFIFPPTRMVQYFVMFGPFVVILSAFLLIYTGAHRLSWRSFGAWWLRVASIGGLLILAAVIGLLLAGVLASRLPVLQVVQNMLGGQSWSSVAIQLVLERLKEPWLFLALSAILALAFNGAAAFIPALNNQETDQSVVDLDEKEHSQTILPGDAFIFLLIITAAVLTWVPEFFYLRDNFALRMNTIFKFYYQAWILFSLASVYALWWLSERQIFEAESGLLLKIVRWIALSAAAVFILLGLVYPAFAINSRANAFQGKPDINGESALERTFPDDWAAIHWLQEKSSQTGEVFTILEAPGKSYNYEGRISAFSGMPTVLGWALHEGQWRGSYSEQDQREPDIQIIYTTNDGARALDLLKKWGARYVVLGTAERNYINKVCQAGGCTLGGALRKFEIILRPVFSQGQTTIYAVP